MGEFLRCEHGDFRRTAEVGLVAREDHIGPAAFGGAELQRILEIIQPEFDGAERIGVADGCDGADAEQVAKKLDRLCCAAITAQDVEEVRQGVPRDVHLVGLGLALFQRPLAALEQTRTPQGDIQNHVRIEQDAHSYFACLPRR